MRLTLSQWKVAMGELIDGVQAELGFTISTKTRAALHTFRKRLEEKPRRKRFEQELEAFLQSKRALFLGGQGRECTSTEATQNQLLRRKLS